MVSRKGETKVIRNLIRNLLLSCLLLTCGCGGGGSSSGGTVTVVSPDNNQPTKAIISFSLVSTAQLPFRISGVQMNTILPASLSVTNGDPANPKIITSGLEAGNAMATAQTSLFPVFGSYSSPKLTLMVADSSLGQAGFGPGEVARLTCKINPGATLNQSDIQAFEDTFSFKASGWDPNSSTNPSSLNGFLMPKVVVTLTN
jgi:hypothetical protein